LDRAGRQKTKKPAAKPWQRVPGIADVAFIIAYISHQNNTAANVDAPPVPGGIDCATVLIGLFHLYEFALLRNQLYTRSTRPLSIAVIDAIC